MSSHRMTLPEFVEKWRAIHQSEIAVSHDFLRDLCEVLTVSHPTAEDWTGDKYAYERSGKKISAKLGRPDVWKRGFFIWEFKRKGKSLADAYSELCEKLDAAGNPPLRVVCDMNRFRIYVVLSDQDPLVHDFCLDDIERNPEKHLRILRAVFENPGALRPTKSRPRVTEEAAQKFARLARALRSRGSHPRRVARFLSKLAFCMFAESAGLLPKGIVRRIAEGTAHGAQNNPEAFARSIKKLLRSMSRAGGIFGPYQIKWFNGGLFKGNSDVILMTPGEIAVVRDVARLDWMAVEPEILGTLFVRGLDPKMRLRSTAQYTDKRAILRAVGPTLAPLHREFNAMRTRVAALLRAGDKGGAEKAAQAFLDRLAAVEVQDPACGCGNFLYVSLQILKSLERRAVEWIRKTLGTPRAPLRVGPHSVCGIEINHYAAELARVTIWIGEIQWMRAHGYHPRDNPVLHALDTIECRDALLTKGLREAKWRATEFVVGNPPFLSGKRMRKNMPKEYISALRGVFNGRLPGAPDLVCYFFEKARAMVADKQTRRVGFIATQAIRNGTNRRVMERIKETGDIFFAWADLPWVLDGANVNVSSVGFDDGSEKARSLDGRPVAAIHANLTSGAGADVTRAGVIEVNEGLISCGSLKNGPFDISEETARAMLAAPNPNGRPNSDVVKMRVNGMTLVERRTPTWWINFGKMPMRAAALYEMPFEYVKKHVRPVRERNEDPRLKREWWIHQNPRMKMRAVVAGMPRHIVTPATSKHRIFVWNTPDIEADHQTFVIMRSDDLTFGVLQSRVHEAWTRAQLSHTRDAVSGCRYTALAFHTFPFPMPTDAQSRRVSAAARALCAAREARLHPKGVLEDQLKGLVLTRLYNERPTWLVDAHRELDDAVLAAYGLPADISESALLVELLSRNLSYPPPLFSGIKAVAARSSGDSPDVLRPSSITGTTPGRN